MPARELLGVLIRAFGLVVLAYGIYGEIYTALHIARIVPEAHAASTSYFTLGLVQIVLALIIVRCADSIARLCYRNDRGSWGAE